MCSIKCYKSLEKKRKDHIEWGYPDSERQMSLIRGI